MYQLIIAEKPSVAQSIAAVLGAKRRENGYLEKIGSTRLCPVQISDEFERALRAAGMQRFLPAFNVIN